MIMGFGRRDDDDDDEDDDEEQDYILFQGALNGNNPDLSAHAKLVKAGLIPAKQFLSDALARRGDSVRLEPKGKVAAATISVDGVSFPPSKVPVQVALAVTQMLKLLAGLDIKVKDKPQAGAVKGEYDGKKYQVRVNTQPLPGGAERLVARLIDPSKNLETPADLGYSESLITKIREISSTRSGLIAVAGPPFSGVTTAMIATVKATDAYLYSIYCLMDMGGRELSHVRMFKTLPGDTLSQTMIRAKREDADVLVIDPLSNPQIIKDALEFSDKTTIVSEMPAKDAADAIARMVQASGNPKLVADGLRMVISQMLIRVLCTKCRQAYRPNPTLLKKIGLPPETKVLYRPQIAGQEEDEEEEEEEPCEACGGTGYKGRTGLLEVIEVTESVKKLILAGADPKALKAEARTSRMQSFQSDGLRLVVEGKTSLEELQRAFKGG